MPKTYTVREVADILGFSTNSIYAFLKEKRINGVRIGKGRFRIPEEELGRILHLSKKPSDSTPPAPKPPEEILQRDEHPLGIMKFQLYDWFIGIAAIVIGIALFLFNGLFYTEKVLPVLPVFQGMLIFSGIGLLASNIFSKSSVWHTVFHFVLSAVFLFRAYTFVSVPDVDGVALYVALGAMMLYSTIVKVQSTVFFGLLMTMLSMGTFFGAYVYPMDTHLLSLSKLTGFSHAQVLSAILIVTTGNLSLFWTGYLTNRRQLLEVSCVVAGVLFFWTAGLYAQLSDWSRSFFYLVFSFFCFFLPMWRQLYVLNRRQYIGLHLFFAGIACVLIGSILVVYVIQQALWEQRKQDFANKIAVGQSTVGSTLEAIQSSMIAASANQEFVSHVASHDLEGIARDVKILYESNPFVRRLIVLDALGDGTAMYPHGTFTDQNYAYREYYIRVRDTKKPYVSDIFITNADIIDRPVVSVTVPLLNEEGEFVGVLSASVNLNKLALKLSQIARENNGEYFLLSDSTGRYIIHPENMKIGGEIDTGSSLVKGKNGQQGVESTVLPNGVLGLSAYSQIPILGWGISLEVPVGSVVHLNTISLLLLFGTLFSVYIFSIIALSVLRFRLIRMQEGGS